MNDLPDPAQLEQLKQFYRDLSTYGVYGITAVLLLGEVIWLWVKARTVKGRVARSIRLRKRQSNES